jgi:broad specificity phosphatase PhoE
MRHAETADPTVFHGAESDIGLSERGQQMARRIAPYVASFHPDVVISSGMHRAKATAQPIADAAARLPLHIEPNLHERRVGILQGQPHTPEHPVWTETIARWTSGETHFTTPGAESLDAIRQRVFPVWQKLTSTFAGRKLVIVGHGMVCKVLLLSLLPDWSVNRWRQFGPIPNLSLSELVWDGQVWRAEVLNQVPAVVS